LQETPERPVCTALFRGFFMTGNLDDPLESSARFAQD
jgi:hypothetical protein